MCDLGCGLHFLFRTAAVVTDVVLDAADEECGLLTHQTVLSTEGVQIELFDVSAVEQNLARSRVVESEQQLNDSGLSAARVSDEGELPSFDFEGQVFEHQFLSLRILESHVLELNATVKIFDYCASVLFTDLFLIFALENVKDTCS